MILFRVFGVLQRRGHIHCRATLLSKLAQFRRRCLKQASSGESDVASRSYDFAMPGLPVANSWGSCEGISEIWYRYRETIGIVVLSGGSADVKDCWELEGRRTVRKPRRHGSSERGLSRIKPESGRVCLLMRNYEFAETR
jgi:hypothetical protein